MLPFLSAASRHSRDSRRREPRDLRSAARRGLFLISVVAPLATSGGCVSDNPQGVEFVGRDPADAGGGGARADGGAVGGAVGGGGAGGGDHPATDGGDGSHGDDAGHTDAPVAPTDAYDAATATPDAAGDTPTTTGDDDPNDLDTDIALVRFNTDGSIDTTFGDHGVARVDFGPGSGTARDALSSLSLDAMGRFVLFGIKKGAGTRIDVDRVVARLGPSGLLDTSFATAGFYTSTFTNLNLNDQSRGGLVQPDGKIVGAGFTVVPTGVGTQTSNRIVLFRLWGGALDATFGAAGLVNFVPFMPADPINTQWGTFEPANVVRLSGGQYVTAGFGRVLSAGEVNLVAVRHTTDGLLDPTWGTAGITQLDVAKQNDRGRNIVALPDDRVVIVGSGSPRANVVHPLITVLTPAGLPDLTFDPRGYRLYDFGYPNEELYGVAASRSGEWIAAVGFTTATGATADATLVLAPVGADGGAEIAAAAPISATAEDRFWAVAFDGSDRAYAAGFVTLDGDSRMVVARYRLNGTLDPTFGGAGGVVTVNVSEGGGTLETARAVVVQPDGKIVIAGEIER